ncbi:hypothetical protein SGLAM104S_04691 [Streptomyces glaucescens]
MNVDAFLEQAEEYEAGGDVRDSVLKILNVLPRSRPLRHGPRGRAEQVGGLPRLPAAHGRPLPEARRRGDQGLGPLRESAAGIASEVPDSKDPLMQLVTDLAGGAGDLGDRVRRGWGGSAGRRAGTAPGTGQAGRAGRTARDEGTGGARATTGVSPIRPDRRGAPKTSPLQAPGTRVTDVPGQRP